MTDPSVLIVGAGPSGLSAARELSARGIDPVVVVDRESEPGGVPRHCDHQGFGLADLHRPMTGPAYARHLTRRAERAGARIELATTVVEVTDDGSVVLVGPGGIRTVRPAVVVLATGARERPRSARLVPGDRPAGVFTTGQLQQWVHIRRLPVGRRAVVVGAEHVAYSAVLTLRHAGVRTVAMVTDLPRHQTVGAAALGARLGLRVPLRTSSRIAALHGHGRLGAVDVEDLSTGAVDRLAADTVVFTGDWIPDHDLARRCGLVLASATRGPVTDRGGRTSRAGVLAIGNLVHPGETAGTAAGAAAPPGAGWPRRGTAPVLRPGPLPVWWSPRRRRCTRWCPPGSTRGTRPPGCCCAPDRSPVAAWWSSARAVPTSAGDASATPRPAAPSPCRGGCSPVPTRTAVRSSCRWSDRAGG